MLKKIFISMLFLMSSQVLANDTFDIENFELWSNTNGSIENIRITGAQVNNPHGCTDLDSYMVDPALPEKVQDRIYSVLLAAVMSGKKVRVTVEGCINNRPKIVVVRVK